MGKMFIVRHSERMDEVDFFSWKQIVMSQETTRNKNDFFNDPQLTENGKLIAGVASSTIRAIISEHPGIRAIYCSRLLRCVETAVVIAQNIGLPIYVSKGLAQTAAAVEQRGQHFEYNTMDELRALCPGVEMVDCDDPSSPMHLPSDDWIQPLCAIQAREESSLVVAHRETIRNLKRVDHIGRQLATSYCCIGEFNTSPGEFEFLRLIKHNGDLICEAKKPGSV